MSPELWSFSGQRWIDIVAFGPFAEVSLRSQDPRSGRRHSALDVPADIEINHNGEMIAHPNVGLALKRQLQGPQSSWYMTSASTYPCVG